MRKSGAAGAVALAVIAMGVGSFSSAQAGEARAGSADYLFAINTERGTITRIGKDTGTRPITVHLRGVSDHVTQFADRPFRDAYVLSTRDFVARWHRWFRGNPPNAVLTFNQKNDPIPHSIVVKLKNPRYREKNDTLTFTAWHIHRQPDLSPDAKEKVALPKRRPPGTFIRGSLFIDSVDDDWNGRVVNGCAILAHTECGGADLADANLADEDMRYAVLDSADLSRANLSGADLGWANLYAANLAGANLVATNLRSANAAQASFKGANLSNATLTFANLSNVNMSFANLSRAGLSAATLSQSNLSGANLSGADLSRATLVWSDLSGADLSGANLSRASLVYANLSGADLSGARWLDGRVCGIDPDRTGKCL